MSDLAAARSSVVEEGPRSALGLLRGTVELYGRYPLLFLILAAGVVVPYEAIVLVATGRVR